MPAKEEVKEEILSPEGLERVKALAKEGKTLTEIATAFDITRSTLYKWSKANLDLQSALTEGKKVADDRVENSLYEQCFDRPTVEETTEYDENGNVVKRIRKTKVIPASVNAIQYWLANRSEGKWKARQQLELTGSKDAPVIFVNDMPKGNTPEDTTGSCVIFATPSTNERQDTEDADD